MSDYLSAVTHPSSLLSPSLVGTALPLERNRPKEGSYPAVGITSRFYVNVDGRNLGFWTSCQGLKVEFKTKAIEEGGNYRYTTVLPERVQYSRLVLQRAMTKADSNVVRSWLREVEESWVNYQGVGEVNAKNPYQPQLATITLYDYQGAEVMTWSLTNVIPVSWSAPDFDASNSKVAMERLELDHHGFLSQSAGQ